MEISQLKNYRKLSLQNKYYKLQSIYVRKHQHRLLENKKLLKGNKGDKKKIAQSVTNKKEYEIELLS